MLCSLGIASKVHIIASVMKVRNYHLSVTCYRGGGFISVENLLFFARNYPVSFFAFLSVKPKQIMNNESGIWPYLENYDLVLWQDLVFGYDNVANYLDVLHVSPCP